jgi:DNA-binding response OmpR family regulator
VVDALRASGYDVAEAADGAAGQEEAARPGVDLVLLDLLLPRRNGLDVLAAVRRLRPTLPVIILTARGSEDDRVRGLKMGADDYVVKPFSARELLARVEAVLRRTARPRPPTAPTDHLRVGELLIAQARGTVSLAGQPIHLTPTEYRLLVALASHPDEVLSREALGQLVWGYQDVGTGHLIDVHIGRLRLKLRRASRAAPLIVTVRGRGYTIAADQDQRAGSSSA